MPNNSSCTKYGTYFRYTESIDLLQLELNAMNYIKENVTNQYCRNYLRMALCVTVYPPCKGFNDSSGVQRICSEQCDTLLKDSKCSSETEDIITFISSEMIDPVANFTINCSDLLSFAKVFLNTSLCHTDDCFSILDNVEVPNTYVSS